MRIAMIAPPHFTLGDRLTDRRDDLLRLAMVVTEKLPVPPIRGGAIQIYINGVLPYLSQVHQVTVLGIRDRDLPQRETVSDIEFVRLPANSSREYLTALLQELADLQPELIHLFNRPDWVLPIHQATPDSKIILSVHNDMFTPGKIPANTAEQCVAVLSKIITISDFIAGRIAEQVPSAAGKLVTVLSGVDLQGFVPGWQSEGKAMRQAVRRRFKIGHDEPVVLHVSRLSPKKGNHLVISAMETVWRDFPKAVLLIVGSKWYGTNRQNDYVAMLHKMAAEASGKVIFTGFVPPTNIKKYFAGGDIFICASQWEEPLARVHYEAMAAGLPIITTDRGGNAEVIRGLGNGLLLEQYNDYRAMGRLIHKLLSHRDEARLMGSRGRELAETKFGWKRVAQEILEVHRQVMGSQINSDINQQEPEKINVAEIMAQPESQSELPQLYDMKVT